MVDFRKWYPALTIAALAISSAATASAQTNSINPFTCNATAGNPPLVRSEGLTELVGDIVLNCTGGVPTPVGLALPLVNFRLIFNTNVTSRLYSTDNTGVARYNEALLAIDEPVPGNQRGLRVLPTPPSPLSPPGVGQTIINPPAAPAPNQNGFVYNAPDSFYATNAAAYPLGPPYNVYEGRTVAGNPAATEWNGIPVDPPGSTGTRSFRFTNIRVDATQVPLTSGLIPGQIFALISVTGTQLFTVNNPQLIVGYSTPGLTFTLQSVSSTVTCVGGCPNVTTGFTVGSSLTVLSFPQCVSLNGALFGSTTTSTVPAAPSFVARFREGFPSAFKPRTVNYASPTTLNPFPNTAPPPIPPAQNVFGGPYLNSESGIYGLVGSHQSSFGGDNGTSNNNYGVADSGTRLVVRVRNVPANTNVQFYGTIAQLGNSSNANATVQARLTATDANGAGLFSATSSTTSGAFFGGIAPFSQATADTQQAVWEVIGSDGRLVEDLEVGIIVAFNAATVNNLPPLGSTSVTGAFAPNYSASSNPTLATARTAQTGYTAGNTAGHIPRFVDNPRSVAAFQIIPCQTNLLFPFVTNQAGFDTGVAIANTTNDPFGTGAQQGPCTLYFFGNSVQNNTTNPAPGPATSASVAAGGTLTFVLSTGGSVTPAPSSGTNTITGAPGFQGYMIARCNFQYAHGFAFITDGPIGQARVAEGYLALVLDGDLFNLNKGGRTGQVSETLSH